MKRVLYPGARQKKVAGVKKRNDTIYSDLETQ